jgi:hypothetical protein
VNLAEVTKVLGSVWEDLRERRLWPVAALLLVGVVAVPLLLSRSPAPPPPAAPLAAGGAANPAGLAVAALNSSAGPAHSNLRGQGRNPFGNGSGTSRTATTPTGGTTSSTGTTAGSNPSTSASTPSAGSSSGSSGSVVSTPAPAGGAPAPPLPAKPPAPAPTGLSGTQSYQLQISMTNASGGLDRLDPVQRLTLLPSAQQPLLVELGVLQGGRRVLFAVAPGTVLRGPGSCVPGPIDCEILSLGQNQIESLADSASSSPAAMFAITDIRVADHPSAAAAQRARRSESARGRQFLGKLSLPALSLFRYDGGVGAVVDLRNLFNGAS